METLAHHLQSLDKSTLELIYLITKTFAIALIITFVTAWAIIGYNISKKTGKFNNLDLVFIFLVFTALFGIDVTIHHQIIQILYL
jgi:hypothetical protein